MYKPANKKVRKSKLKQKNKSNSTKIKKNYLNKINNKTLIYKKIKIKAKIQNRDKMKKMVMKTIKKANSLMMMENLVEEEEEGKDGEEGVGEDGINLK